MCKITLSFKNSTAHIFRTRPQKILSKQFHPRMRYFGFIQPPLRLSEGKSFLFFRGIFYNREAGFHISRKLSINRKNKTHDPTRWDCEMSEIASSFLLVDTPCAWWCNLRRHRNKMQWLKSLHFNLGRKSRLQTIYQFLNCVDRPRKTRVFTVSGNEKFDCR